MLMGFGWISLVATRLWLDEVWNNRNRFRSALSQGMTNP